MAPKVAYGNLPKAAAEFKAMLMQTGQLDMASVATGCAKQRNKAITAMSGNMTAEAKEKYKSLGDDARHQFIAEYLLDPRKMTCQGTNTVSRNSESGSATQWVWVTESELGGPKYMNDMANAKIAIQSLESKDHTNKSLAKHGVKMYHYEITKEVLKKTTTENTAATASCDMDPDAYSKIRKHMSNSGNPGLEPTRPEKKQKKTPKEIEDRSTPEKLAWKAR